MSPDVIVGVLTLAGIVYMMIAQSDVRRTEARAHDADAEESRAGAITQLSHSLIEAVEKLADRDTVIAELRSRIELLEESDRRKMERIADLEAKVARREAALQKALAERDALLAQQPVSEVSE